MTSPAPHDMETAPHNFLGLEPPDSQYERARFAVLPIPYDATTSYRPGTREGPAAVLAASLHLEEFDEELGAACSEAGIATLKPVEPNLAGPLAMHEDLFRAATRVVRDGKFLFSLGGDHSITSALVRAVMTRHPELSVLQIDAHSDLRDSYQGTPYSHACVMRRVLQLGASLIPVGIRSMSEEEHRFMREAQIKPITARDCHAGEEWIDRVLEALSGVVYVTIDIDAFDPACAPGTGTPEPGGLDWDRVTRLLRRVASKKNVVGADLVEVMPLPGQAVTEFLAAKLAYKLMGYVNQKSV